MGDESRESARINYKDERKLDRRYMEFPVRTGGPKTPFYLYTDDELITVFEIELEHTEADGYFVKKRSIEELKSLRGKRYDIEPQIVKPDENPLTGIDAGEALEIEAEVRIEKLTVWELNSIWQ